ncbi:hypothetical protein Dsin_030187 [Dipteronia sinensis]|uniref:DUF8040 domain-containing protein n=1 Tax=Dipteronia sinensis TaxID=43782 RepID=A0AAD9ZI97_9ROSI|nr:hypothetical protein Dsin_030187 [Dipteronia sinensis]
MENYLEICSEVMSHKFKKTKERISKDQNNSATSKRFEEYSIEECMQLIEGMDVGDIISHCWNMIDMLAFMSMLRFFVIVSHSVSVRVVAERFQCSKDTIHRQFKRILKAICGLTPHIIQVEIRGDTPLRIMNNSKYYPYFKKCIGAIDETHVAAWSHAWKQTSYRGRKVVITQNVMCACSFDMMFTFVYTG